MLEILRLIQWRRWSVKTFSRQAISYFSLFCIFKAIRQAWATLRFMDFIVGPAKHDEMKWNDSGGIEKGGSCISSILTLLVNSG